jgi:hypothetical protein
VVADQSSEMCEEALANHGDLSFYRQAGAFVNVAELHEILGGILPLLV